MSKKLYDENLYFLKGKKYKLILRRLYHVNPLNKHAV